MQNNKQENNPTQNSSTKASAKCASSKLMRKNFVWNFVGTMAYAFTSLFFMIIVTRINGVEQAGIFTFAFSFATMVQVIALYQGRTFQVTERSNKVSDSDFILFKIITCLLMIIFGIVFLVIRDYELDKNAIIVVLLIYKCLDGFAEALYGVFQKNNKLYQCGISLFLKSVFTVLVFLLIDVTTSNLLLSCVSILIADLAIFAFYDLMRLKNYKVHMHLISTQTVKFLLIGGLSVFVFTFLSQYLANAQKYVIDFMASHTDQTIFGIVIMPATFISLCAQLIINPFLYDINNFLKEKAYKKYRILVIKISIYVLVLGIAVIVISYFIGIPLLNFIYGIKLNDHLLSLLIILAGSTLFGIVAVISNALISIRKNVSQIIYYLIASIASTILAVIFIPQIGVLGAAISFCIAYFVLFLLFTFAFLFETKRLINK